MEKTSAIARQLSVAELSQRILDMGKTGVYRASLFEALGPVATQRQIRAAIAHAKHFGLHSVSSLRDAELGTYYQLDLAKYQTLQHLVVVSAPITADGNLIEKYTRATATIHTMLNLVRGLGVGLAGAGAVCVFLGKPQVSFGLLSGAVSLGLLWAVQRAIAQRHR
ncbi:MAG: hypothetical protein Fur0046_19140 [Cyanobacteria bacterium J069]|nr:MAG: hypothetical protein D6742_09700 [Cyanobacteria bacterium J069]